MNFANLPESQTSPGSKGYGTGVATSGIPRLNGVSKVPAPRDYSGTKYSRNRCWFLTPGTVPPARNRNRPITQTPLADGPNRRMYQIPIPPADYQKNYRIKKNAVVIIDTDFCNPVEKDGTGAVPAGNTGRLGALYVEARRAPTPLRSPATLERPRGQPGATVPHSTMHSVR